MTGNSTLVRPVSLTAIAFAIAAFAWPAAAPAEPTFPVVPAHARPAQISETEVSQTQPAVEPQKPLPSYASPALGAGEEKIRGAVAGFDGKYGLTLRDERGFIDHVTLHDGTIINPTGIRLAEGMSVTIVGRSGGNVFAANEIDTPYLASPSLAAAYPAVPAYDTFGPYGNYGYGYGLGFNGYYNGFYPGFYGYGYPGFAFSYYGAVPYYYGGYYHHPHYGYYPHPGYRYNPGYRTYGTVRTVPASGFTRGGGFRGRI